MSEAAQQRAERLLSRASTDEQIVEAFALGFEQVRRETLEQCMGIAETERKFMLKQFQEGKGTVAAYKIWAAIRARLAEEG